MASGEQQRDDPEWRDTLLGTSTSLQRMRRIFRRIPSDPRCKVCESPQGGVGGPLMSAFGFGRYPPNPQLCNSCFRSAQKHPGGAEIEITAIFADIRGSTGLAERVGASEYSAAVADYVRVASSAIRERAGIVDRLLGDGVMALYVPGFIPGGDHARAAVESARTILRNVSVPVGIGAHSGVAWVGFLSGADGVMDFTALGDAVNVASRLGSEAAAGELLLSAATADAASIPTDGHERRTLQLRGRTEPLEAWSELVDHEHAGAA